MVKALRRSRTVWLSPSPVTEVAVASTQVPCIASKFRPGHLWSAHGLARSPGTSPPRAAVELPSSRQINLVPRPLYDRPCNNFPFIQTDPILGQVVGSGLRSWEIRRSPPSEPHGIPPR
jgi:hypothetical protein